MSLQGETTPPAGEAPIEESMPTIEEHVATVSDATATSKTQQENEESIAMVKIENETDITKEEIDMRETLPPPPPPAVDEDDNGDIDVAPAQNDASTAGDDAQGSLPLSPASVRTGDGDGIQLGKSYMSPLEFNESTMSRDTPNESILTSPKINDEKRNAEFLNDTLNISPIVSDTENTTTNIEADSMLPCSVVIECAAMVTPKSSGDHSVRKSHSIANATTPIDPVNRTAISMESNFSEVAPQSKMFRSSQCSTPIQSNHSPISSKFKPQTMGRGAQLLKLINSNKNHQQQQQQKICASPTMTMSAANEQATILVSTTASPSICKLQTAPIYGATVSTPEPANDTAKTFKSELLTLSRPLPSPYESPRFSILKRKASKDADDDPIHSPAHKRKRVSFNFPLTETVEFLTDDEMAPIGVLAASAASNNVAHREIDALSIRSPANVKYKMKLKKRIDGAKDNHAKTANESPAPSTSLTIVANKLFRDTNEDEVSVEHIKEYLELNSNTHREKQEKLSQESVKDVATPIITTTTADADSDAAALSLSDCEASAYFMAAPSSSPTPPPITLNSFSDNEIFQHLFQKFSISDIVTKYEDCKQPAIDTQLSRFFSRKLSAIMANDASIKVAVLDELAEKHSTAFLDHAVTENLCSTICDRLLASSKDSIVDYVSDKMNSDQEFAASILNRLTTKSLHNRMLFASTLDEKHQLLIDIIAQLDTNNAHNQEAIVPLLSKVFAKFNFTPEQFHEFTKLHILKAIRCTAQDDAN